MFSISPHVGGIRIPESGKFFLVGKILLVESGIQGFGIQNRAHSSTPKSH